MTEDRNTDFLGSIAATRIVEVETDFGICTLQAPPMADVMECMTKLQADDDGTNRAIDAMVHLLALSLGATDEEAWAALTATGGAEGPVMKACLKLCGVNQLSEGEEQVAQVEVDKTLPFAVSR